MTGLVSVLIPDVPSGVKTQIQREKLLAREVLFEAELNDEKQKRKDKKNQKTAEANDENLNNTLRQRLSINPDSDESETILNDIF